MSQPDIVVRPLEAVDFDAFFEIEKQAFNTGDARRGVIEAYFKPERTQGAFVDGRLMAVSVVIPFGQYFGGQRVPMGGLSSVMVMPEARGQGLASKVVIACLEDMRERGEHVSALFPATTRLYRSLGWEIAGRFAVRTIAAREWLSLPKPHGLQVRRASRDDLPAIKALHQRLAPARNGNLDRGGRSTLEAFWDERHVYLVHAGDELRGYVGYAHLPALQIGFLDYGIRIDDVMAVDRDALVALARLLASSGTQADRIEFPEAALTALDLVADEQRSKTLLETRWLLRVVDAEGAIAARGFPAGLRCRVPLALSDAVLDAKADAAGRHSGRHSGRQWWLVVEDGRGQLEKRESSGADDAPSFDIGAFSSLYSGWATCDRLARAGRIQGGTAEQRAQLDAAFAGEPADLVEHF